MAEHESAAEMQPSDVPNPLVHAAWMASIIAGEPLHTPAIRAILAAVLPLHEQRLRKQLAAANERAETAEARLAEHKPGPVLRAWRGDNGDIIHGDEAWIRQAIRTHGGTHVIADTCTWVSEWREAETADATAAALSATETDAEGVQAWEDANSSSILPQGLSEPEYATGGIIPAPKPGEPPLFADFDRCTYAVRAPNGNYWWAEHDPENALSPDHPWRVTLQTNDNMCHSLEGISFDSEQDCLDYIKTHIINATLDQNAQARRDSVVVKLSDGVAEIPRDVQLTDALVEAMREMGCTVIKAVDR